MFNNILIPLTTSTAPSSALGGMGSFLIFIPVIILLYFFMTRSQKKKEKAEVAMRKDIQVGDEVITIGGIIGIVFSVKENSVVIETGGDRSKIRVTKAAIAKNETIHENNVQ